VAESVFNRFCNSKPYFGLNLLKESGWQKSVMPMLTSSIWYISTRTWASIIFFRSSVWDDVGERGDLLHHCDCRTRHNSTQTCTANGKELTVAVSGRTKETKTRDHVAWKVLFIRVPQPSHCLVFSFHLFVVNALSTAYVKDCTPY
jgi:hypothetical protein